MIISKSTFKEFVAELLRADLESNGKIDAQTARNVQPLDAHLAGLIQQIADAKIAIHRHVKSRVEG